MYNVQPFDTCSSDPSSDPSVTAYMTDLLDRLRSESLKNQLQLVQEATQAGDAGFGVLMSYLQERQPNPAGVVEGKVYQALIKADNPQTRAFLETHFPQGIVPLNSDRGIDYSQLQILLAQQDFETADRLTIEKLCELAGPLAIQRKWLYFTEVEKFPTTDLKTIDTLWQVYSEGKFGYSVQRELWLGVGKNWEKLWFQIGWKNGNNWTRYPQEFTWDLTAPRGHLPLSNQLRGVRVIAALLSHPAWNS